MRSVLLIAALLLAGCMTAPPPAPVRFAPPATMPATLPALLPLSKRNTALPYVCGDWLTLCPDLHGFEWEWIEEASRRVERPFVLTCHGATPAGGVWSLYPPLPAWAPHVPVRWAAWTLRAATGRPIVLIVCNDHADTLGVPGVWYARQSVWGMPGPSDRMLLPGLGSTAAGSIDEFVHDDAQ